MDRVVEIIGFVHQGITEPVFCRAADGCEYVVKGHYAGRRALIAEWVANRLGSLLRLPIPEFKLLWLDPQLVQYSVNTKEIANLGRGGLFGSQRQQNVVEVRPADLSLIDGELKAKILAFDWWIANSDRTWVDDAGNPNLLWCEQLEQLFVIDHNLAFSPSLRANFWNEHIFRDAWQSWSPAFCQTMGEEFRKAIKELPDIWNELPDDWLEVPCDVTLHGLEELLGEFENGEKKFWSPL